MQHWNALERKWAVMICSIPLFWVLSSICPIWSLVSAGFWMSEAEKFVGLSVITAHIFIHKRKFCAGYVLPFFLFKFQPELEIWSAKDGVCLKLIILCDPALMCQMVVGTQLLHSVSFTAPRCWLLIVYGSSLLIVIFPPDCNCWSWLSAVDCGDQWWERRKPARWERRATTTTAGGGFATDRGVWGQSFAKFPPRPMSGETRIEWICKFYWQSCV